MLISLAKSSRGCVGRCCWSVLRAPLSSASHGSFQVSRRAFTLPLTERLTRPVGSSPSESYVQELTGKDSLRKDDEGKGSSPYNSNKGRPGATDAPFAFAITDAERGILDHGVSPEAKDFIAEAEAEYRASVRYLSEAPEHARAGLPETEQRINPATGQEETITRIAAPFGESYVPSSMERYALRGHVPELDAQRDATTRAPLMDERAQLNLRKERQLSELLASPMPLLPKVREATSLLEDCYSQQLALLPPTAETVMMLMSRASLQLRLRGAGDGTSGDPQDVPLLADMRLLYAHQKLCFTAPTPLTVEHLMVTVSAALLPSKSLFHFANRLFLDCDKYVVLPTRSTYTAFFAICQTNDAMPFAIARFKDAVAELNISLDAGMATALLKGLNEGGYTAEAVLLLGRLQHVPMATMLFNATLETLLLSKDPLACFATYEALQPASLKPNAETFTLLLLACEQSGQWGRVTKLLADMQKKKVKGNRQTLNLMLKGLMKERLNSYALQLYETMERKGVDVWPALEQGVRQLPCFKRLPRH